MSFKIQVFPKDNYLHVRVEGENSRESAAGYLSEVRSLCAEADCPNVLIEEDLKGPGLSLAEIYGVVTTAGKDLWPIIQKVAYVDVNPEHSTGFMRFAAKIGISLGIGVYVFQTVLEAEQWIRAEAARPG